MQQKIWKLGDFCRTGSGGTPSRSQMNRYYEGGDIPWVKSGELREGLITSTEEHVTQAALRETSIKLVPAGAILLAMYGATVGRLAILGVDATTNQAVCHIVPDPVEADTRYLYHALSAQVPAIIAMGVGGAQPNISQSLIKDLKVSLPPIPEQRRIAAILDQADALRAKRREALTQLGEIQQSLFMQMFVISKCYPEETLDALCELITDGTHQTPTYVDEGVLFLSAKNVTSGRIDWSNVKYIPNDLHVALHKRLAPKRGDILLAKNGTTGVAAVVDRDEVFDIYVSLALLRPHIEILPSYLLAAINSPICKKKFNQALKGIGVPNLHLKEIKSTKVPNPPIEVQQEFERRMQSLAQVMAQHQSSLSNLNSLFFSLQHRAFAGEL